MTFDDSTKIGQSDVPLSYSPTVPVSVVIIVKDCATSLRRTIESLKTNFLRESDEVLVFDTGSESQETADAARELGARVIRRDLAQDIRPYVEKWIPEFLPKVQPPNHRTLLDFSEPRRIAGEEARHDIQLWIDADDVLIEREPGKLRATVDRTFAEGRADSIFLEYLYAFDQHDGRVTTTLKRERVYDRRRYRWIGRCHETAIPVGDARPAWFHDLCSAIKHEKPRSEGTNYSDIRNYVILRKEIEESGSKPDTRSIFYLGNAARGLARDAEAIELYNRFIPLSGSRDDRFAAAYYCGLIYLSETARRPIDALDYGFLCCRLKPEDPRGPYMLSRAYYQMRRFNECLHWFRVGRMLPALEGQSTHSYDPTHADALPLQVAVAACKELGSQEHAIRLTEELLKIRPDHPDTKTVKDYIQNWVAETQLVEGVRRVLANSGARDKDDLESKGRELSAQLAQLPPALEDMGLCPLEAEDGRTGEDLGFYCGKAPEPFGPRTTAMGGSEKAVVMMAPRMQRRGFRVTVYCNVPRDQRGIDPATGVRWEHFGSLDKKRPRGTIVFWRSPEALELPVPAERRILWCHDVQSPARWTPARVALADEVWVLSEFHASTLGSVREQLGPKVWVTRNGIDADLFRRLFDKVERSPYKIVYASSPDRGVLRALRVFSLAKEKYGLPKEAKLHVYYGFTPFYLDMAARQEYAGNYDLGRDANMYDYLQQVLRAVDVRDDVVWRGRLGWEELAKEMCSAGALLYPTKFPEISCMALMEAQAAGLVPLVTGTGALSETFVGSGCPLTGDEEKDAAYLARSLSAPVSEEYRLTLHREACERFDYERLADEWAGRIREPVNVAN